MIDRTYFSMLFGKCFIDAIDLGYFATMSIEWNDEPCFGISDNQDKSRCIYIARQERRKTLPAELIKLEAAFWLHYTAYFTF